MFRLGLGWVLGLTLKASKRASGNRGCTSGFAGTLEVPRGYSNLEFSHDHFGESY